MGELLASSDDAFTRLPAAAGACARFFSAAPLRSRGSSDAASMAAGFFSPSGRFLRPRNVADGFDDDERRLGEPTADSVGVPKNVGRWGD